MCARACASVGLIFVNLRPEPQTFIVTPHPHPPTPTLNPESSTFNQGDLTGCQPKFKLTVHRQARIGSCGGVRQAYGNCCRITCVNGYLDRYVFPEY